MRMTKRANNQLHDEELKHVVGGAKWSAIPCDECFNVCNNPDCVHYGHYVSAAVGPEAPDGAGRYHVCDFCGELMRSQLGVPILFK